MPFEFQFPTAELCRGRSIEQIELYGDHHGGTGATATGPGFANTTFKNPQTEVGTVDDLDKADVGALWKHHVSLEIGPECLDAGPIDIDSLRDIDFSEAEEPDLESVFESMKNERYGAALDSLDQLYRRQPNNPSVRRLMLEAEGAYLDQVRNGELRSDRIPVRTASAAAGGLELQASEAFLLNSIDDMTDIQSLLWIAPQGELEVMRTFERLLQKGLLELRDPAPDDKPRSVAAMLAGAFEDE